jgi:hypothetical protein
VNLVRGLASCCAGVVLAACQSMGGGPTGPAPRACSLASFGNAPGLVLQKPRAGEKSRRPASKSEPLREAGSLPVNRDVGEPGTWVDAGAGWRSWRFWLRSEEARSMAVRLQPFSLPPGGELWLCSPDGTARLGPYTAQGPGGMGQLWSSAVPGNEIWVEALVPAGDVAAVKVRITEAFAASR